ncbi:mitochondrial ribosomal subunit S27-domain-containing protein [Echria macrotheca]|uniref:Small ribosomal subunit protein mS33 n=1 Tax=Echria macrotheca TaxID=438768 RepID=A0AAJ0BPT4_9PEZI|nr:mitochondrial ribosomal subunit S27-domain-containing protein [Echria macrotheca]
MSIPRARLLDLMKARCQLFSTTFNPDGIRTGNKVLRQRLRGPALVQYYPGRLPGIKELRQAFASQGLDCIDEAEEDRLEHIEGLKARGKGAPKKKKGGDTAKGKKR